jgi:ferrochelatase
MTDYDALLLLSFGGPEGPGDVIPFLENVTRGRGIPRERLAVVGQHYALFDGASPINGQNRELLSALRQQLDAERIDLPLYWGNRNWHPMLADTVAEMTAAGHQRVLAIVTSAFGSYSGCRQYSEDLAGAVESSVADITIDKAPLYWNHPGFLTAAADHASTALRKLGPAAGDARLVFTAHSIPAAWVNTAPYLDQLNAAADFITHQAHADLEANAPASHAWDLVFQSRSGPPEVPWLEPDINDHLRTLHAVGTESVVVIPLGFVSDHMEVVYDLDTEAAATAAELGMTMVRAATAGTHPAFVAALADIVGHALADTRALVAVGEPWPHPCAPNCCDRPQRPAAP